MRSRKNDALTMSYTNSAADYQTMSETPRHKTGTKRHKNFDVKSALSRGIFTDTQQLSTEDTLSIAESDHGDQQELQAC
jgi:hypothetical protein